MIIKSSMLKYLFNLCKISLLFLTPTLSICEESIVKVVIIRTIFQLAQQLNLATSFPKVIAANLIPSPKVR